MTDGKAENRLVWSGEGNVHLFLIQWLWLTQCSSPILPLHTPTLQIFTFSRAQVALGACSSSWSHLTRSLCSGLSTPFPMLPFRFYCLQIWSEWSASQARKVQSDAPCTRAHALKYWNCHSRTSPALTANTYSHTKEYLHIPEFCII